jgi:hypothetical protein
MDVGTLVKKIEDSMTLQIAQIIVSAAIAGMMVGYGFWIRNVVKQQGELKDAGLEALRSALTAKDAEISRLNAESAPNIIAKYKLVKDHAEQMTNEASVLAVQFREREEELQKALQNQRLLYKLTENQSERYEHLMNVNQTLGEVSGLSIATQFVLDAIAPYMGPQKSRITAEQWLDAIMAGQNAVTEATQERLKKLETESKARPVTGLQFEP